jgi:hypothetical protein
MENLKEATNYPVEKQIGNLGEIAATMVTLMTG